MSKLLFFLWKNLKKIANIKTCFEKLIQKRYLKFLYRK